MTPFVIRCRTCQRKLKVRTSKLVGRRLPCPKCGAPVQVKAPKQALKADDDTLDLDVRALRDELPKKSKKRKPLPRLRARERHLTRLSRKTIALIFGAVLIVVAVAVGVHFAMSSGSGTKTIEPKIAQSSSPESQSSRTRKRKRRRPSATNSTQSNTSADSGSQRATDGSRDIAPNQSQDQDNAGGNNSSVRVSSVDKRPSETELADPEPITLTVNTASFDESVKPFLTRYCAKCHGPRKQSAELRLDQLKPDFSDLTLSAKWTEVLDRVNAGEMPPENSRQPDRKSLLKFTNWMTTELARAASARQSTGGQVVLRRLNRNEYRNTIADLLGIDYDTSVNFPEVPPASGFDNSLASTS